MQQAAMEAFHARQACESSSSTASTSSAAAEETVTGTAAATYLIPEAECAPGTEPAYQAPLSACEVRATSACPAMLASCDADPMAETCLWGEWESDVQEPETEDMDCDAAQ